MNKLLFAAFAVLIATLVIFNVHTGKAADAAKASREARSTATSHPTILYQGEQRYDGNGAH